MAEVDSYHSEREAPIDRRLQGPARPVLLDRVQVSTAGVECDVSVTLQCNGGAVTGNAHGPSSPHTAFGTVAAATLGAVVDLLESADRPLRASVDYAAGIDIGAEQLATVLVTLATHDLTEQLPGVAIVRSDPYHAAARATLSAVNRRLEALLIAESTRSDAVAAPTLTGMTVLADTSRDDTPPRGRHAAKGQEREELPTAGSHREEEMQTPEFPSYSLLQLPTPREPEWEYSSFNAKWQF